MKIERLRNKKSKLIFLCGFLVVVVLLITVIQGSKAKYRSSQIIPLITNKSITNKIPSFTTMGVYLENVNGTEVKNGKKYQKETTLPSGGYVINETSSYCEKFNSATNTNETEKNVKLFTNEYGQHIIYGISKASKCFIYLDKGVFTVKSLLTYWGYPNKNTITERTSFNNIIGGRDTTNNRDYVYKTQDDDGTSYYLAGNPKYNWVKFGGHYWRIVRINGDGSLRMIYSGTNNAVELENGTVLSKNEVSDIKEDRTYQYNLAVNNGIYSGYWYAEGELHGKTQKSLIYNLINNFFKNGINETDKKYIDLIAGFCNDRILSSKNPDGPLNGMGILYSIWDRWRSEDAQPTLTCQNKEDLFTTATGKANGKGNGVLEKPIGLLTADEAIFAGIGYGKYNSNNFLSSRIDFWTMTPGAIWSCSGSPCTTIALVSLSLGERSTDNYAGVKPVINLIKSVTFSKGNGTISSPFEI